MTTALSRLERGVLAECELAIERGVECFIEVGNALLRIRNERLFRAEFRTFQEYCQARHELSELHARRMIDAAEVAGRFKELAAAVPASFVTPLLEALEFHESNAPDTPAWRGDSVKVEVCLGDLRAIRQYIRAEEGVTAS